MAQPVALCIEDLGVGEQAPRFVRCVALVGRQPGLRLSPLGEAQWQPDEPVGCELWVSADERLIAYRPREATTVVLDRAGRQLELPVGKPVVVLDQDRLIMAGRTLRLHLHGVATAVSAPSPLPARSRSSAAHLAAVMAVGAAVVGCERPVEIRDHPPEMVAPPPDDPQTVPPGTRTPANPFASPPPAGTAEPTAPPPVMPTAAPSSTPPIEVRDAPPEAPAQ